MTADATSNPLKEIALLVVKAGFAVLVAVATIKFADYYLSINGIPVPAIVRMFVILVVFLLIIRYVAWPHLIRLKALDKPPKSG